MAFFGISPKNIVIQTIQTERHAALRPVAFWCTQQKMRQKPHPKLPRKAAKTQQQRRAKTPPKRKTPHCRRNLRNLHPKKPPRPERPSRLRKRPFPKRKPKR